LADAIAGFVRDNLEEDETKQALQKQAEKKKVIKKI